MSKEEFLKAMQDMPNVNVKFFNFNSLSWQNAKPYLMTENGQNFIGIE